MNSDEVKSLIVRILLVALGPLATKYGIDGNTQTAVALWLATGVVLIYGIYDHWNMKKVPEKSIAIHSPNSPMFAVGEPVVVGPPSNNPHATLITGTVVGLFLLCMVLPALAQTPPTNSCDPTTLFKGLTFQNLAARFKQCSGDDLAAAIKDATAQSDNAALACLTPMLNISQSVQTGGLMVAFQAFRDAKLKGVLGNCINYVNTTISP